MKALEIGEKKLLSKIEGIKAKYIEAVKSARTLDEYVKGIANATGLPESAVRASLPVRNFTEFQKNAEIYAEKMIAKLERAVKTGKWKENYIRAFKG